MATCNRQRVTKFFSSAIVLMGVIHVVATFMPVIADKLVLLYEGVQGVFTYFSLMCGVLLILGGGIVLVLAENVAEYPVVRKPYVFTLAVLDVDGVFAVGYMPHNPFAWVILALVMGLTFANEIRIRDHR